LVVVVIATYSPRWWAPAGGGDVVDVFVERCGEDAVVVEVGVEAGGVAVSQFEGRGGFPVVVEPVDGVELDRASGGAQFGEHAATRDRVELVRVTDEREPPPVLVGEVGELVEVGGGEHAGLVDDDRRAGGEPPGRFGWPVGACHSWRSLATVSRSHAGPGFEDTGRLRGGGEPEHRPPLPVRSVDRGVEHGGLAGAGGPTTNTSRSWPATAAAASVCIASKPTRPHGGGGLGWVELVVDRPGEDVFFLGEDVARWCGGGRTVRSTPTAHPDAAACRCRWGRGRHTRSRTVSTARSSSCAQRAPSMPGGGGRCRRGVG
jgi:hypothetical protein